jgi:preprotein translocase subunit SecE
MTKEKEIRKEIKEPNRIQRYFRETVGELRKVSWPTRDEATYLTTVVIVVIAVLSSFLAVFDILFSRLFVLVLGVK